MELDAHEKPPVELKAMFKKYQKTSLTELERDESILDFSSPGIEYRVDGQITNWITDVEASRAFHKLGSQGIEDMLLSSKGGDAVTAPLPGNLKAFQPKSLPGLFVIPSMFPVSTQRELLDRLFHRDLQNPMHKTNVHLHHHISYPDSGRSFFTLPPSSEKSINPKDPNIHKPLTVNQFLSKKLRWITLGGQYDWTNKVYPDETPPDFPSDLAELLHTLFPQTTSEAAIVNLYTPGDTLSLHRDVSESCDNGLISVSIGCDALFVVGLATEQDTSGLVIRLRSGDVLYMTGSARFAWHGVPKIIPDTCPVSLKNWPCDNDENTVANNSDHVSLSAWRGWMASKRINLNVRQMRV